ncbi:DUF58 domain-containing protein [Stenotrophomonas sp. HITSZ_GD]|uniref:DUF58 domain-containing protein n=1 Tax=Stenotrophomonas sp. HITSZ_GD TaxID=3037248 RepID=UPI00240E0C08|nr:DUF58 domain-containing protein [Stenotrophomonas sp. HITSZ_GD]MDG2526796.1 DUF58 domain-containing protein [Stenotrophomonas sp. HITSZ_GD]
MTASPAPAPAIQGDGLRPTLAELIALRGTSRHRAPPGRGRLGITGPSPSALRGRGMEYAESREYVVGDDARHIDWRLTARSGRAHTKLFQAERERLSLIVADTAPTLYFGTRVRFKSVQAARAAAVAAWQAQRQGDRVAALRGSLREAPVAPAGGARGVLRVLDALTRWYAQPPADDAGLALALDHAGRLLRPGARLSVFADPHSAAALPLARWSALALHHEVVLVLLVDPLELSPPSAQLPFLSGERRIELDLAGRSAREGWQHEFVAPLQKLQDELPARRVAVRVLRTDDSSDAWLGAGMGRR